MVLSVTPKLPAKQPAGSSLNFLTDPSDGCQHDLWIEHGGETRWTHTLLLTNQNAACRGEQSYLNFPKWQRQNGLLFVENKYVGISSAYGNDFKPQMRSSTVAFMGATTVWIKLQVQGRNVTSDQTSLSLDDASKTIFLCDKPLMLKSKYFKTSYILNIIVDIAESINLDPAIWSTLPQKINSLTLQNTWVLLQSAY